jgi:hypothetical protein
MTVTFTDHARLLKKPYQCPSRKALIGRFAALTEFQTPVLATKAHFSLNPFTQVYE